MKKILIEHARILTMDEAMTEYEDGWLLAEGGRIAALGEGEFAGDCGERIDARGGILLPGFVNTHCHASMVPFRTMGDDCPDRLRRFLFPLENEAMTRELVYLGALYGIAEMLLAGVTTFCDMYYFEEEVARACMETGMRGYLGETIIGQPTCDSAAPYGGLEAARRMLEAHQGDDLVRPILAPHGTTTCDAAALRRTHELAQRYGALMTLHAAEMDDEMRHFAAQGKTPISYMKENGVLTERVLAVHCIHMTPEDIDMLAGSGAAVAHCIGSNMKAGKGIAPLKAMRAAGVRVGLGTDGPSSGNTLSMFDQMRLVAVGHKTRERDRSLFPAREIVAMATRGGAQALGAGEEFGMLKPGMRADAVLVSTRAVHMFPVYNPYSTLVYGANASDVDTVMAGGKLLVRGGALTGLDIAALRGELAGAMAAFTARAAKYADII